MKISDAVKYWPPAAWVTSFKDSDELMTDASDSVVTDCVVIGDEIRLNVKYKGLIYSSSVFAKDQDMRSSIASVLQSCKGKKMSEVGDPEIS